MAGWGNGRYFFPLSRDFENHPLYRRQPDRDVALLLMRDAHHADSPAVRFSYPVFQQRTSWWDGNDRRVHGRDAIRNSLVRMAEHGFLTLPEPAQRRGQGRQQGWFIVTLCNYGRYKLTGDERTTRQATRPAQADNERATPRPELEERDESSGSEAEASSPERTRSSAGADTGARVVQRIWNENRGNLPKCEAVNGARERRMRLLHAEAGADEALLASTAAAFAADPFNRERGYGIDTLTRAEHRSKWLDRGRNGTPTNGKRELPDWAKALPGGDPE